MNSILIKPHHFIDIIKLYGSGIDRFVPDEKMGHDFYKVANEIIENPSIDLKLTIDGDDICKPCKKYHEQCVDPLTHIQGYTSKDVYNNLTFLSACGSKAHIEMNNSCLCRHLILYFN